MEENLFSYGTLQLEAVQLTTFGRKLKGFKDALVGYVTTTITIADEGVVETSGQAEHLALVHTGNVTDRVEGMVYQVEHHEFEKVDTYEGSNYKRVIATMASGITTWVYVKA
ncbi:gamma-glutamylcyclotransferase family protein [Mucilaginibacter ginkgonis]|uniref:Gamma-glutamylcyclotransferase n=1 Tax=Mucilaginibacter ginkgonis TaxID=2682091 RepID=A0A6I4HVZ0_9SPHI|nr:gamma-glutamylcyclotransferase family protein [Mucilaginibacter ginkgonis]QQL51005.1 gamma-glutamylcyclotransferase [Mucilaginibacter ginkgonis]